MGHVFKKQYGQNFLKTDRFAHKLVDALQVEPGETVIEIGPGDGKVTNVLLHKGVRVIAIEIDYSLLANLVKRFRENPDFELINQDIMQVDIPELQKKYGFQNYKVAGSLPYNISKQIIYKFLVDSPLPIAMAFIVQEEVAQDYTAPAPKSSFLSNWIRIFAQAKKLESIPASQFFPKPKVNGAILRITPYQNEKADQNFARLIRTAFSSPRKTIRNNLTSIPDWTGEKVDHALQAIGKPSTARPAELTFAEWQELHTQLL